MSPVRKEFAVKTLLIAAVMALLPAAAGAQTLTPEGCASLTSVTVPPARIALPTSGAHMTAAKSVAASGATPAHCLVSGEIAPVDSSAPPIRFQVALPLAWNGKALGLGGGGFNGTIPAVTSPQYAGSPTATPPLARGYAIFASDSGHSEGGANQGMFMGNDEALANYLGGALKKTRDTAVALIATAYGKAPSRTYFFGGSTGGREALWVAGRWPRDWDGIVAFYPARDLTVQVLGAQGVARAFAAPGAFVPPAKRALLFGAAMEACDGLDGVRDGVISNVPGCNARFVPARATYQGKTLRCPDGKDGDGCLSDAQLTALAKMQAPLPIPYRLASGVTAFPGYNAYASDLGIKTGMNPIDQGLLFLGLGTVQPAWPARPGMSIHLAYADAFLRYGVVRDPAFDTMSFDPQKPGAYAARLSALSKVDSSDADLSPFAARGGKLLILHGQADMAVSVRVTEAYVARLRTRMGPAKADRFLRFYEVPGFSHGASNTFNATWDYLGALENWVEKGRDPGESEVITDVTGVPGRTRPLCRYPNWPRYKGTGDVNAASSFTCAAAGL
jgi:Tannase and feruloyl esterase